MIELNKSNATKFSTDPVPVYWHNLPEDIVCEIFSHIVPEDLLGISSEPLSLIDKKISHVLSQSHFWIKKFKRHFPLILERMTEEQKKAISDWRQKFIETRKFLYPLPKTNPKGYFYYYRLASELKENDLDGAKKTLSCFKSIKTADGKNFKITQLFLIGTANPVFGGSVLQLTRKSNQQDFLNEFYNVLAACVKDYLTERNASLMLNFCIYWALHCKQPFQSILDMIEELKGFHENESTEIDNNMNLGMQPVHMAAQAGNVEFLKYLIGQNRDLINVLSDSIPHKQTPLIYAIMVNEPETAMLLIQEGADLKKGEMKFPFHLAAANGMKNVLSILLEKDPSLLDEGNEGRTALDFAITNKQDDTALWLLDKGADCKHSFPRVLNNNIHIQSIHSASINGRLAVIKKMYEIDPTCLTAVCSGMTALHSSRTPIDYAVSKKRWSVVKFMLLNGAKVSTGFDKWNPFAFAIWTQDISIAILMLSYGAIRQSLPTKNRPHHQFPWSKSWDDSSGFSFPWETKPHVAASKEFILVWDLLDYIEERASPNYVRPFNILEIFSSKKSCKEELAAAEALRDIIYKNEAPESLKKEVQTIISDEPRLLAVFTWFKNEYYPKFILDPKTNYSETTFVLENEIKKHSLTIII